MDPKKLPLAIACAVLLAGCSDLSEPVRAPSTQPSAPAVAEQPVDPGIPDPLLPEETSPPTSVADLKAFANACDKLLAELDHAHRTNRLATSVAKDNGESWGRFANSFTMRLGKLRVRGNEFAPMQAKIVVGSVSDYLDTLFLELRNSNPEKYREFRQYVGTLIEERDAYLADLRKQNPLTREFTDTTGKFRVTATLLSADATSVKLQRLDGREVTVPTDRLSSEDREWIAQQSQNADRRSSDEAR